MEPRKMKNSKDQAEVVRFGTNDEVVYFNWLQILQQCI